MGEPEQVAEDEIELGRDNMRKTLRISVAVKYEILDTKLFFQDWHCLQSCLPDGWFQFISVQKMNKYLAFTIPQLLII